MSPRRLYERGEALLTTLLSLATRVDADRGLIWPPCLSPRGNALTSIGRSESGIPDHGTRDHTKAQGKNAVDLGDLATVGDECAQHEGDLRIRVKS